MDWIKLPRFWPFKSQYAPLHTTPEKPLSRLIFKLGDTSNGEKQDTINLQPNPGQSTDDSNSVQKDTAQQKPCCCCCQNKISNPKIDPIKFTKLKPTLPRFGPCYGEDTGAVTSAKKEAWEHVLNNTITPDDQEQSTPTRIYHSAMKKIETEARATYAPDIIPRSVSKAQFQEMMIIDGCFFLQWALSILGGPDLLGYTEQHVYFGKHVGKDHHKEKEKDHVVSPWVEAMFFAGNQIPYIVIQELMKQSFFQDVIEKGKQKGSWSLPSDDLPKMLLYLLVVSPHLGEISKWQKIKKYISSILPGGEKAPYFQEEPSDLLHAFHSLVLGPETHDSMDFDAGNDYPDLEAGTKDHPDKKTAFPSATELEQSGIKLIKAEGGIRDIHFKKKCLLFGRLYVPPFTFNVNTLLMFGYLKNYENRQKLGKNEREAAAYLRFMRDLIQTRKDVKILMSRGIIKLENKHHKHTLPGVLNRLCSSEELIEFTQNLRLVRIKAQEYSSPPWHYLSLAFFLTVVQTIFTILAYVQPHTN